ncbi:MAG TPA: PQQ-binding-like beta-propeller repeat protein [Bryobacteraceae bacterium]|nr:PQQ-binding-like beta-propeller repeat protein [Bryobacteraceae bacterium]
MRDLRRVAMAAGLGALVAFAADWPMQNGGPERNGWARSEHVLTKANIKNLRPLYEYRAEDVTGGLTAPIINGNLITYRGFKEMLIFAAKPDRVFSVDADLNKTIWDTKLAVKSGSTTRGAANAACEAGASNPVAMAGSSSATMHFAAFASRTPAVPGQPRPPRRSPYFPPLWQSVYPMRPETLTQLAVIYTVSSDGYLHILNSSTGADLISAIQFVPAHAKVTSLNVWQNMVYATTADNCDGYRNALYAVNLLSNEKRVLVFSPEVGGFAGSAGTAIGREGTVYVQLFQPADRKGDYEETVLALTPRELNMRDSFSLPHEKLSASDLSAPGITPIVFSWLGKQMVAAGMHDGRVYLLDAQSLGGADHHTPLFVSDPIAPEEKKHSATRFRGAFTSWQNVDTQERWIYAPVEIAAGKKPRAEKDTGAGKVVALKLSVKNGATQFSRLWASEDLAQPTPAVIANGMLFLLSRTSQPVLHALDALSGKELYTSGNAIKGGIDGSGLAVANGRVYFSTSDNTVYCFGLAGANLQLTEDDE